MPKRPLHATVQVGLRLKENLRRLIEIEAKKAGRSLNQELVWRLERSFELGAELEEAKLRIAEQELAATLLEQARATLQQTRELQGLLGGTPGVPGLLGDALPDDEGKKK
jgi:hypothetical protein